MDGELMETSRSNVGRSVSELRLPPGFRFTPTDPELIWEYLKKQVNSESFEFHVIAEVDLSKYNPWQLPELHSSSPCGDNEWYFFTRLEKKYPRGSRPNRAAGDGYWKATGTDKPIFKTNHSGHRMVVGLRKSLVFYEGKAPRGEKTNWIMHEYRLTDKEAPAAHRGSTPPDDWVLCRIYRKASSQAQRAVGREVDLDSMLSEFDEQIPTDSPTQEQEVVDNATTTTFPGMMHNIPGAMSSTVPGMQQIIASSNSWTSLHTIASSSQHGRLTHEFAGQTDLQAGPAINYLPQSSSSFTGPEYYTTCIGADAGQRNSFSDDLEEVQSQFGTFAGYGECALFPGFNYPPADDQSSMYPRPNGLGSFGYGQPLGRP